MQPKPPLPSQSLSHARKLRTAQTDAEAALWFHLRGGRLRGLKFRRQHAIPPYVVDFYCESLKLIIELDGSQHTTESDRARSSELERQRLRVIRFWNNAVLQDIEAVLTAILFAARSPTLTPTPLPMGEGLKQAT